MENPWISFNPLTEEPLIHNADLPHVESFNQAMSEKRDFVIAKHLEPLPYLGNPNADVVVLLANPGVSEPERQLTFRMNPEKSRLNRGNLIHAGSDSFKTRIHCPENRALESQWWKARVQALFERTTPANVADGIFIANFHAYHSRSWHPIPFTFPTQTYTFELVRRAVARDALILMSRNMVGWFTAIPGLYDHTYRKQFVSSRSVHLSPRNLGADVFESVVKRIS